MLTQRIHLLAVCSALAAAADTKQQLRQHIDDVRISGVVKRRELYEALLQVYLFAGFPAALEALRSLRMVWKNTDRVVTDDELLQEYDLDLFYTRGKDLYKVIYHGKDERVREELLSISPELGSWALIEGYGKTLSRDGLDVKTRELCIVAMLTRLGWDRQLFSHIFGAHNAGASRDEIREVIAIGAEHTPTMLMKAEQLLAKIYL